MSFRHGSGGPGIEDYRERTLPFVAATLVSREIEGCYGFVTGCVHTDKTGQYAAFKSHCHSLVLSLTIQLCGA